MREDRGDGWVYVNRDAPNQCEDFVDELQPQTQAAARRTVASYAVDVEDCRELLLMLGLHPNKKAYSPRVGPASVSRALA